MNEIVIPGKDKMVDSSGRPITQSMFLEMGYSEAAIYTLKDDHYVYEGKLYPSLGKLYVAEEDPTEYQFAIKYLLNWRQWLRLCENKKIKEYIDDWREELEMKLRSKAFKEMMENSKKGKIQASKWIADKGWAQRGAGRPSKQEVDQERKFHARMQDEYGADVIRLHTGT